MKKILSTLLVAAMLLSLAIVAVMPTAAVEGGDWNTFGEATQYDPALPDDAKTDVSGYGYNVGKFNGFTATGAKWTGQSPFTHIQSTEAYDLKNGIYVEYVVEAFDYTAGDKWFNVNFWSQPMFAPPSPDPALGYGVQTLLRGGAEAGNITSIQWEIEQWTGVGSTSVPAENRLVEEKDGVKYDKFVVEVTYDEAAGYHMTINGLALAVPEGQTANKVDAYLNEVFGGENSKAYVGFALHNTTAGAEQVATVTKFGTDATNATAPTGNYSKDAANYSDLIVVEPPMNPDLVEDGAPAILMTGNLHESDLWGVPSTATGSDIRITDDYTVAVTGKGGTNDAGTWKVKLSKNYNIKDFPTYMVITKDLCTCGGDDKTECEAWEEAKIYFMMGDIVGAENGKTAEVWVCEEAIVIDGHVYHYFTVDLVEEYGDIEINNDGTTMADGGRINGVRLDVLDLDPSNPDSLYFEVCAMGFFRTTDDAEDYAFNYFASLGYGDDPITDPDPDPDTDPEAPDTETEAPDTDASETEAPVTEAPDTEAPNTEAPDTETPVTEAPDTENPVTDDGDDDTTEAPEQTTKAPEQTTKEEATTEAPGGENSGCGSVVGFGAVAVIVAVAAGFVSFKKKED